ncbi:MAG: sigma-E factor negative regulatory protein [Methylomonas sp.]|nr:sigma-E factor negative regulatory protein [Methylomonas sp.]
MQEPINEKLSLLFDDQLDTVEAYRLLKATRHDEQLQLKLQRYALIAQSLKSEQCSVANLDFVDKVSRQLEHEPIYLLPHKKHKGYLKKTGLAVAASLVLAVLWLSASRPGIQGFPNVAGNSIAQHTIDAEQMNARFKEYLLAHDNVWYVNNNVGVQSYARVASYQQK